jgi:hypothetical protein
MLLVEFIHNYYSYGEVYKELQMMNIVLFKELIQKVTGNLLQPAIKMSEFNQNFFIK